MIPRIVKRGDSYSLCYRYTDHADKTHIKLEPCTSLDDVQGSSFSSASVTALNSVVYIF